MAAGQARVWGLMKTACRHLTQPSRVPAAETSNRRTLDRRKASPRQKWSGRCWRLHHRYRGLPP